MSTADSPLPTLTLAQEFSQLISNITSKELDFLAHESIEILHDFRVDLRMLRTWLKIIELSGYPVQQLKKRSLHCHYIGGDLRNFDVLLHWIQKNNALVSLKLFKALKEKREKLKKAFLKELMHGNALQKMQASGRDFIIHIKELNKKDLEPYVQRYIEGKIQQFNRILPTAGDDLAQLHEMRKIFKKIRYSLQLFPITDQEQQHAIKEIQDMLGYINDRRVWITLLESFFAKNKEAAALITVFKSDMHAKIDTFKAHILNEVDYPIGNFMKR